MTNNLCVWCGATRSRHLDGLCGKLATWKGAVVEHGVKSSVLLALVEV